MDMNEYQAAALLTAIYPDTAEVTYPLLGLIGEVGEFANKYKKTIRDGRVYSDQELIGELGDILWYFSALVSDLNLEMNTISEENIAKLYDRQQRGVLGGSGDNR